MSIAALNGINGNAAGDVFETFRVIAPDNISYIPSCFIMTAVREMSYYPTVQQLQNTLLDITGRRGRLTFQLFLQLCSILESTRALETDVIQRYRCAFDIHNSGILTRGEFRTILATSAAADITSSELEAIVELLDPTYTDTIQLHGLQAVLMRYLSKDNNINNINNNNNNIEPPFYTPRSARKGMEVIIPNTTVRTIPPANTGILNIYNNINEYSHLQPRPLNFTVPEETIHNSKSKNNNFNNNNNNNNKDSWSKLKQKEKQKEKESVRVASPEAVFLVPTAPSPFTSGTVTRATSLQPNISSREPIQTIPELSVTRGEPVNEEITNNNNNNNNNNNIAIIDRVEKPSRRGSENLSRHSLPPPPSHISHTVIPIHNNNNNNNNNNNTKEEEVIIEETKCNESVFANTHTSRMRLTSTKREPIEPSFNELKDIMIEDSSSASAMGDSISPSHEGNITVKSSKHHPSTRVSITATTEDEVRTTESKKAKKMRCDNCCQMF